MAKNIEHIENRPDIDQEIMKMISGTRINWGKTKEEIWSEMIIKSERPGQLAKTPRLLYLNLKRIAIAAMLLIVLGIPSVIYSYTKTVKTLLSQTVEVFMPDNSRAVVYEQSVLTYKPLLWRFSRTVHLNGEALFDVKKGRTFEVVSPKGKVAVLGTQFDVYARGNEYNVTCFSGKVKVTESEHRNEAIITSGQKTVLKTDGSLEIIRNDIQPEDPNNLSDKVSEDERNKESSKSIAPVQEIQKESGNFREAEQKESKVLMLEQSKEETLETDYSKASEDNLIKEQNQSQNQILEELQYQNQSKGTEQMQNKSDEGELIRNQDNSDNQKTGNRQNQDKFRNSLTPEQIKILENEKMSREERQKAFMESLSHEQLDLLKERNQTYKQSVKDNANGSVGSNNIKEQQKVQMQEQDRKIRSGADREQKRQQNRDNRLNNKGNK